VNWFQAHRMEWITDCLHVFGFVNREHLMRKFQLSQPQASKDLAEYQRRHPKAMIYNTSTKRYERRA
jgi:hypothetical protein